VSERRRDPLTGEWRTFATHRQDRMHLPPPEACPLCPGPHGEVPDDDVDVFVFPNRWPSFRPDPGPPSVDGDDLYEVAPAVGAAEVVVYDTRHDATLADLSVEEIARIVDVWSERTSALGARPEVRHVFVFENRGEEVGVTLHHPHGQIYGYPEVPPSVRRELEEARRRDGCTSCLVVAREVADGRRIVVDGDRFLAHVPFAARFPYEVHVVAREHLPSLPTLDEVGRRDLAAVLSEVVRSYDRLFGFVLPYVLSVHQAPTDGDDWSDVAHLRVQLTPLHRAADKLKFLAGSELHAGAFLNDTLPEATAAELRASRP